MNGTELNLQSRGNRTISPKAREAKRSNCLISILNDDGMVACGFLGHKVC